MPARRNKLLNLLVVLALLLPATVAADPLTTRATATNAVFNQIGTWECFDPGMADPCRNTLEAVAMLSVSDGWAVGENGTILRWNGSSWLKISGPTSQRLYGVTALTANTAWAVGDNGTILHWNGSGWTSVNSPTTRWLASVAMVSASDGWAVGDGGIVLRWNGSSWTHVSSSTYNALFSVAMLSSSQGWAVGSGGTIISWNGSSWNTVNSPTTNMLYSVAAVSTSDGWAVGENGTILRWNGNSWTSVNSPTSDTLYGVSMRSATEGWAVGSGLILRWNGSAWTVADNPSATLYAVSTLPTGDSWTVGPSSVIMRWDGSAWVTVSSSTTTRWFEAMAMVSINEGWAVGNDILHWDGSAWSAFNDAPSGWFYDISVSPGDRWIVGDLGTILRWNGTTWSSVSSPTGACLYGLDLVTADDGWSVGANGTILHWNGNAWTIVGSPTTQHLYSVSMVSADNGWAVGNGGTILHWNGSEWAGFSSPTSNDLRSIAMVSASDGWAVGLDGTILHWNGSEWNSYSGPVQSGTPLSTVLMVSGVDGWIVGPADQFLHWDGNTWTTVSLPETSADFYPWGWSAIAMTPGTGGTNGWAISRDGLILQYRAEGSVTYSISGFVKDSSGNPIPEVTVSSGAAGSTITDADGYYILSGLSTGTYTLTPSKDSYSFTPASRTVSVPPDAAGVDFTGSTNVSIFHIEITQAIQDELNYVPLIAGKPTFVRVYVDCGEGCTKVDDVTGGLEVSGLSGGISLAPINGPIIAYHPNHWTDHRKDLNKTLNFIVPHNLLSGTVTFTARVGTASLSESLPFAPGKKLRVAWVPVYYQENPPSSPIYRPNIQLAATAFDYMSQIYPVGAHDLDYFQQPIQPSQMTVTRFKFTKEYAWNVYLPSLDRLWRFISSSNGWIGGQPDRLFGWVSYIAYDIQDSIGGAAYGRAVGGSARVATGLTLPEYDGVEWSEWILAHEIGHTQNDFGLSHSPCNAVENFDPDYPKPNGLIDDWGVEFIGTAPRLQAPDVVADFMSYCHPDWMSKYHYRKLAVGFQSYSQLYDKQNSSTLTETNTYPILSVIGTVYTPTLTVDFGTFYPLNSVVPPDDSRGTDYCLELRDVSESVLATRCFDLSFTVLESREPMDRETFTFALPYPEGTHSVVFAHLGTELGRVNKSNHSPTVQLISPNGGESWSASGTYTVTWIADDADNDALNFIVSYSDDDGATWMPLAVDIETNNLAVDSLNLPGSTNALFKVTASDQMHSAEDASDTPFTVNRKDPLAFILTPDDGDIILPDIPISLHGYAYDLEDGILDDLMLSWSSNQDDDLGIGRYLLADLSPGQQLITLTATDNDNNVTTTTISVFIGHKVFLPLLLRNY